MSVWVYPHRGVSTHEFINTNLGRMLAGLDGRMADFVQHRGLVQKNEGVYLSRNRELERLSQDFNMYHSVSKWLKCQNPNNRAASKADMPTCKCKYCNAEMAKPEWQKAPSLWDDLKQHGLLKEQAFAKLRAPIDARIRLLKETAP